LVELIWIGFFALFFGLLFLDLSVLHREASELSVRQALFWTAVWIGVGLSYTFVIYGLYEYRWYGFVPAGDALNGADAVVQYVTGSSGRCRSTTSS
jgi:tellurite resistance protein TerC